MKIKERFFIPFLLFATVAKGDTPPLMTVTANQGTPGVSASPWPVILPTPVPVTAASPFPVTGTFFQTTQPVSGSLGRTWTLGSGTDSATCFQGSPPWANNVTQFGSTSLSTGTGASGSGIPRVTVSNDSNVLATQFGIWTMAQGTPAPVASGWPIKITDGTNTVAIKASNTSASATDTSQVVALSPNSNTVTQGTPGPSSSPWPTIVVSPIPLQATAANQVTMETTLTSINTVQTSGTQKTQIVDGSGNVIGSSSNNLYVGNGATYKTLTTAATTTLKSGGGILFTVCINSISNGTVLTLYDNTAGSGNVIMAPSVVTGGLGLGAYVQTPTCLTTGGVIFSTGLTAVVTGTGASFSVYWK